MNFKLNYIAKKWRLLDPPSELLGGGGMALSLPLESAPGQNIQLTSENFDFFEVFQQCPKFLCEDIDQDRSKFLNV